MGDSLLSPSDEAPAAMGPLGESAARCDCPGMHCGIVFGAPRIVRQAGAPRRTDWNPIFLSPHRSLLADFRLASAAIMTVAMLPCPQRRLRGAPGRSTSAIPSGRSRAASGLRPVISLDDRDVRHGVALPQAQRVLIFGRAIASKRGVVVGKLDHHEP